MHFIAGTEATLLDGMLRVALVFVGLFAEWRNQALDQTADRVQRVRRVDRPPLISFAVPRTLCRLRHEQSTRGDMQPGRLQRVLEAGEGVWGRTQTVWARAAAESPTAAMDLMRCPATCGVAAPAVALWLDSASGRHPMIQASGSERASVARIPQVAVDSGCRGVAVPTPNRRWPGTTRCNELAVIVMRGGDPVGRWPLIAPFEGGQNRRVEIAASAVGSL